ncbi:hypothetical protein AX16_000787 [Volvariella volvacea WC 439]|nr:hypothetical protein AX16_000787 [Volvariella volvacea WC 439]
MSSHYPPQLQLSLPAGATSFKRTFEEFGFDLDSPTAPTHSIGEGSTGYIAGGSADVAPSSHATSIRQGSGGGILVAPSHHAHSHTHDGNDRYKRARSDNDLSSDSPSGSSSSSPSSSTSLTNAPGNEVDFAESSRSVGAIGSRSSASPVGQHLHYSHTGSSRGGTGRFRSARYGPGSASGHSSSYGHGHRRSASSSSSSRPGFRHSVLASSASSSSTTLPSQNPQPHSPTSSAAQINSYGDVVHEPPPRIPTPRLMTDDIEMQIDEDTGYSRISTPPPNTGHGSGRGDSSHLEDHSSPSASESSGPQLLTPSPGTSLTSTFAFSIGTDHRLHLPTSILSPVPVATEGLSAISPPRPITSSRRQQLQHYHSHIPLSSRSPTPPPVLPPLSLSQDPLAVPNVSEGESSSLNDPQQPRPDDTSPTIDAQQANINEDSPASAYTPSDYESSGSGSSSSVYVSASPASSEAESLLASNSAGGDDYAPIRERLASALDVLRTGSPLFNSSWEDLGMEGEGISGPASVSGPPTQTQSESGLQSAVLASPSASSAQPPRIDVPIPSNEGLIPIPWASNSEGGPTEPSTGPQVASSPAAPSMSSTTTVHTNTQQPPSVGENLHNNITLSPRFHINTSFLEGMDRVDGLANSVDDDWFSRRQRRASSSLERNADTGISHTTNAVANRRSASPQLNQWDRSDSDDDDEGRAILHRLLHAPRFGQHRPSPFPPFLSLDHSRAERPGSSISSAAPAAPVLDDLLSSFGFDSNSTASRVPPSSFLPSSFTPARSNSLTQSHNRVRLNLSSALSPSTSSRAPSFSAVADSSPSTSTSIHSMADVAVPRVTTTSNSLVVENAAEIERRSAHADMMRRLRRQLRDMEDTTRSMAPPSLSWSSSLSARTPAPRHRSSSEHEVSLEPIRASGSTPRAPPSLRPALPSTGLITSDAQHDPNAVPSDPEGITNDRLHSDLDGRMTTHRLGSTSTRPIYNDNTSTNTNAGTAFGVLGFRTSTNPRESLGADHTGFSSGVWTAGIHLAPLPAVNLPTAHTNSSATANATATAGSSTSSATYNRTSFGDIAMASTASLDSSMHDFASSNSASATFTNAHTSAMDLPGLDEALGRYHPVRAADVSNGNSAPLHQHLHDRQPRETTNRWSSLSDRSSLNMSSGSAMNASPFERANDGTDRPHAYRFRDTVRGHYSPRLPPSGLGLTSGPSLGMNLGLDSSGDSTVYAEANHSSDFPSLPSSSQPQSQSSATPSFSTSAVMQPMPGPLPSSSSSGLPSQRFLEFLPLPSPSFGSLFEQQQAPDQQRYANQRIDESNSTTRDHGQITDAPRSSTPVSMMDISPSASPVVHLPVFRAPSATSWFRLEFGSNANEGEGNSSRHEIATSEAPFERRSPSPRPEQRRPPNFGARIIPSSIPTSLNQYGTNHNAVEASSTTLSSAYVNLDPNAFEPGPFRNTVQRVVQDRRTLEERMMQQNDSNREGGGAHAPQRRPLSLPVVRGEEYVTTSTLGRRSRDSAPTDIPTAHGLYPSSIQTSYRPALLNHPVAHERSRPEPPTEIFSHLRRPDQQRQQVMGEEERRDIPLHLRRFTRMRSDNPELRDTPDASFGLRSRSDIAASLGPAQSGFSGPPSSLLSSVATSNGSISVNAPPTHSTGSSGGFRHAIEALSHDASPPASTARPRRIIPRDYREHSAGHSTPPFIPIPPPSTFRRVAAVTQAHNIPNPSSASSSTVDRHHHHHQPWSSIESSNHHTHHTPSFSWMSVRTRDSYEDREPPAPLPSVGSASLRERLFSRRPSVTSNLSRGEGSNSSGGGSGSGGSRDESNSDRPSPPRSRLRGGTRFLRGGNTNNGGPRSFGLGDYMRDEDFDESYESLLTLASMLGEVKPKHTPDHVISSLAKGLYREWKTAEADTRCPICLDDYQPLDSVMKLNDCSHWLHRECLETWLRTAITCPVCRKTVKIPEKPSSPAPEPGPSNGRRRREDDSTENSRGGIGITPQLAWLRDRRR